MPIDSTRSKAIAEGFTLGKQVTFPTPYLGLFTTMPGTDGTGGVETNYPEYSRVKLNSTGVEGKIIMANATIEAGTGDDAGKNIAVSKNQEIVYFPEAETGAGGTVVGIGLFSALTGGTPYMWKPLEKTMTINQNSVPMFRIGKFAVKVK
jgi:hypothetical protein